MKNSVIFSLLTALMLTAVPASTLSQTPPAYRLADESGNPAAYNMPYTMVRVTVTIERESVKVGPYARFAQKYLGIIAPLSDRESYTVKSASLAYADPNRTFADEPFFNDRFWPADRLQSHLSDPEGFVRVTPDRLDMSIKSDEDRAREAAELIFRLRRTRLDLLTGEIGENVYGGGLGAALEEISRLENECLSLFLGKVATSQYVRQFDVVPEQGKMTYQVFRFSASKGIVPDTDLESNPVVLMFAPEGGVEVPAVDNTARRTQVVYYRVPDWTLCRLMHGPAELVAARFPVYQFGATVQSR